MFLFKSCPRCRGDLNLSLEGELTCLQCGHEVPKEQRTRMLDDLRAARLRQAERAAA